MKRKHEKETETSTFMVSFSSEKDTREEAACTCHRLCLPSRLVRHMSAVLGPSTLHSPCLAEKKWQPRAKCREASLGKRQPLEVMLHPGSAEPDLTCTPQEPLLKVRLVKAMVFPVVM